MRRDHNEGWEVVGRENEQAVDVGELVERVFFCKVNPLLCLVPFLQGVWKVDSIRGIGRDIGGVYREWSGSGDFQMVYLSQRRHFVDVTEDPDFVGSEVDHLAQCAPLAIANRYPFDHVLL